MIHPTDIIKHIQSKLTSNIIPFDLEAEAVAMIEEYAKQESLQELEEELSEPFIHKMTRELRKRSATTEEIQAIQEAEILWKHKDGRKLDAIRKLVAAGWSLKEGRDFCLKYFGN